MIKIYNTLSRQLEEFKEIKSGEVTIYACGPTVYNNIHIGNARPIIFFDTVRRYFEYRGYKVKYVQNFTDIDDKMIKKANEEGKTVKEIATKYIDDYFEDTKKLNIKEEDVLHPKATDYIGDMIKFVKKLVERGYAYESNGDVYFRVGKFEEYGKLSKQKLEELNAGERVELNPNKEEQFDFTLWKTAKEGEPSWGSPWGKGRPGWHLECSVMSLAELGANFDLHCGGQDLIFPHHENEIAQSECANDSPYANYWMHNGYINIKGNKMSKSKGNFFLLREILENYEGRVVRFFMLSSHYRKSIEFSEDELKMAKTGLERIENSIKLLKNRLKVENFQNEDTLLNLKELFIKQKEKFENAMDEDFNTAMAIGAIFELVKELNRSITIESGVSKNDVELLKEIEKFIHIAVEDILGIEFKIEDSGVNGIASELIELLIEIRKDAKSNKNWELSDKIRDDLNKLGVVLKDGRNGTTWEILT